MLFLWCLTDGEAVIGGGGGGIGGAGGHHPPPPAAEAVDDDVASSNCLFPARLAELSESMGERRKTKGQVKRLPTVKTHCRTTTTTPADENGRRCAAAEQGDSGDREEEEEEEDEEDEEAEDDHHHHHHQQQQQHNHHHRSGSGSGSGGGAASGEGGDEGGDEDEEEDEEEDEDEEDDREQFGHVRTTTTTTRSTFRSRRLYDECYLDADPAGLVRGLLVSLHQRVAAMNVNLSAKLEELHSDADTVSQLRAIRLQLAELARTVDCCQGEVQDIKKDVVSIKCDIEQLQATKEEIEELRDCVERLEESHRRRRIRLLEQGLTCHLIFAIFAAVLGMFQFGYNTGVVNAPGATIQDFIDEIWHERYNEEISDGIKKFLWSVAVSIFAIGGMVGGFLGGSVANRFGRKRGLMLAAIIGIIGGSCLGSCKRFRTFELLIVGRFVIGVNCGLYTSLSPMYVSEVAPINLRGGLGTVNQLAVTIGLLLSQILGIDKILGTPEGWHILFGLAICPSALQFLLLLFCPESPRYLLLTRGWEESSRAALVKLRNCANVEDDIEEMRAEDRAQQEDTQITMLELIRSSHLRLPLLIAIMMQLSQQLSGINAVLYYSTILFVASGLSDESARYATIGVGAVMVGMTIASIPLMDRSGRRTLMLYGLGGMFIFSIFITISLLVKIMLSGMTYMSVASILLFVVFFAVGPGSIPWMITAELFSQGPRPAAISIASLVNWSANFAVGIGFPPMQREFEDYTFMPFTCLLALFWIFAYHKVPETKNKTFEEIAALFRRENPNVLNSIHGGSKLCQLRENSSLIAFNQSDYGLHQHVMQENAV